MRWQKGQLIYVQTIWGCIKTNERGELSRGGNESQYLVPYHAHTALYLIVDWKVLRAERSQAPHGRVYYLGNLRWWTLAFRAILQKGKRGQLRDSM